MLSKRFSALTTATTQMHGEIHDLSGAELPAEAERPEHRCETELDGHAQRRRDRAVIVKRADCP
jgi:hypothetical protein